MGVNIAKGAVNKVAKNKVFVSLFIRKSFPKKLTIALCKKLMTLI